MLYAFLIPFEFFLDYVYDIDTVWKPYRLVGIAVILLFLILHGGRKIAPDFNDYLLIAIHAFGVIVTLLVLVIGNRSFLTLYNYIFILFSFLLYLCTKKIVQTKKQYYSLFNAFLLALIITGLSINIPTYFSGHYGRFSGFYKNPNYAAFAINVSVLYLLHLFRRSENSLFPIKRVLLFIAIIHQALAVMATGSRSGIILLVASVFLSLFVLGNLKTKLRVVFFAVIMTFLPLSNLMEGVGLTRDQNVGVNRITRFVEEKETDVRFYIWASGLELGINTGFTGVGIGQFREEYFLTIMYQYEGWWNERSDGLGLHSQYLTILIEYGLIPFILLLVFFYRSFRLIYWKFKTSPDFQLYSLNFTILFVIAVFCATSSTFINPSIWFLLSLSTVSLNE